MGIFSKKKKTEIKKKDIESIKFYGDKMIWNVHLSQEDKKSIYHAVKPIAEKHPELDQLWKEVHYKVHGYEPYDFKEDDDPWIVKGAYSSREDIIDR